MVGCRERLNGPPAEERAQDLGRDLNHGVFRGGDERDYVSANFRSATFNGGAGSDGVYANGGPFGGGRGGDRVRRNKSSATFYGGPGFDTVKVNGGVFIPDPQ